MQTSEDGNLYFEIFKHKRSKIFAYFLCISIVPCGTTTVSIFSTEGPSGSQIAIDVS